MARARNIKPGFFSNEQLAECDPLARLLFVGLWCIADREGRLQDRPRRIKAELLGYDECNVDLLLSQLDKNGLIKRYTSGEAYIQIINFTKHQDPHYKEKSSEIPAMDGHVDSGKTAGGVSECVRQEVFDRDGRKCLECGSVDDLSLDHKIPRSKGGSHDKENLQTLCRRCNSAKNNRQAKSDIDGESVNHRPIIGQSLGLDSKDKPPLIPSSLNPDSLIPDTGLPSKDLSAPSAQTIQNGTRLSDDWALPKAWGDWALSEKPELTADAVRTIADNFRDYWVSLAGAKARKVDWQATWRVWVRNQKIASVTQFKTAAERRMEVTDAAIANWLAEDGDGSSENVIEGEFANA